MTNHTISFKRNVVINPLGLNLVLPMLSGWINCLMRLYISITDHGSTLDLADQDQHLRPSELVDLLIVDENTKLTGDHFQ